MKVKILALFSVALLVLNLSGLTLADTKGRKAKKRQTDPLVALLPASDGVMTMDVKRFFGTALPKLLSSNQKMLGDIMAKLNEMESKTGIDLRKFDSVVVGVATKKVSAIEFDFDPVVIARGEISAGGLVSIAKIASNGTYKEEKIGERIVYIFSAKQIADKNAPQIKNSTVSGAIDRTIDGLTHEIALTALDKNTLVLGSLARVRETLERKTKVSADLIGLLAPRDRAVMSFAGRTPDGMSHILPLDNDELGKNIDSIRFVAGSMDVIEGATIVQMMARTQKPEQAQGLLETLEGLQTVGKAFLGGSKREDQKVYARMIENAKIVRTGNDVTLDLSVPQGDIDILIAGIK